MKEQTPKKRPASPKTAGAAKKAPQKNSPPRSSTATRKSPPPPPKKSGLSGATILLILITLLLAAILFCFALPHLLKSTATTDSAPLSSSPSEESGATLPLESAPSASSPAREPSEKNSPSQTPSAEPTPIDPSAASPSPSPVLPSESPSKQPEPVVEPYLKAVTAQERKKETVKEEFGYACTLNYHLPVLVLPGNEKAEKAINEGIQNGLEGLLSSLRENYNKNYSGMFGDIEKEITVHFHKSESTLSVVFYYTEIAGGGEFVEKCRSLNFDRTNGESLTVFHRIKDKAGLINYVTANIDGGEHPDLDILHREPGQGGYALCHAWYIDGNTLTLLYNGKTVDSLNPALLTVMVNSAQFFTP